MSRRVMFYVQHLLGIGHLKRAAILAREMAAQGLEVWVVLGGIELEGIDFDGCARVALPPIRALNGRFATLVDEHGAAVDDALREARVTRILTELEAIRPDVLLIEQFPFGRRAFRFELMPLLARARTAVPRPRIVSSVRDVLVRKSDPARRNEMVSLAKTWFDRILVHGDHDLLPLEASFPEAAKLAPLIRYTGYVAGEPPAPTGIGLEMGRGEVVVSAGGGAVGEPLLRLALEAKPLTRLAKQPWRVICGPNLPQQCQSALAWDPPPGVIVERWRPDLPLLLRNCVLSISQAGYNTVVDVIQAKARAVVVPYAEDGQTEQELRARVLAERGLLRMVDPAAAAPETLARAVDAAAESAPAESAPAAVAVNLGGAATTARDIVALCGGDILG